MENAGLAAWGTHMAPYGTWKWVDRRVSSLVHPYKSPTVEEVEVVAASSISFFGQKVVRS